MSSKKTIKDLNPNLFPKSGELPGVIPYEVILVSRKITKVDEKGNKLTFETFKHTTNPSQEAIDAGIKKDNYFRAFMVPAGLTKVVTNETTNETTVTIRSKKKAPPHNIFKNTQTLLYDEIEKVLREYEEDTPISERANFLKNNGLFIAQGTTRGDFETGENKQKKYKINGLAILGLLIAMNVPKYAVHRINAKGEIVPLTSTRRDSKGNYHKDQPVHLSIYRFWADEDDIEELAETCTRHYENNVKDFEVAETVVTKKTTHKEEKEIISPKLDEAPAVDNDVEDETNVDTVESDNEE